MKKILIVGANGKIGKILTQYLVKSDEFTPHAMLRKEEQKGYFEDIHVDYSVVSLEDTVDTLAQLIGESDGVVFTAGSGGNTGHDKTLAIDLDGAVKCMEAAEKAKVSRFIMVSATRADDRLFWDQSSIKPYYIAKHYADRVLKGTKLDYTILRPGRLLDDPGTGKIEVDPLSVAQPAISREDVARVIVEALRNDQTIRKTIELTAGESPIGEVLATL